MVAFTNGTFDLFHIGHLNFLNNCKQYCDQLIVGVNSINLAHINKKDPIISENDRLEIIKNIKSVDTAFLLNSFDLTEIYNQYHFDLLITSSDWFNTDRWKEYENIFTPLGVKFLYLDRTKNISSSILKQKLRNE